MGDCGVCIYSNAESDCEFVDVSFRKARKAHKCSECGRRIEVGEKYEHYWGKYGGECSAIDTCAQCAEIADGFYCDCRVFGGGLWESMWEVMGGLTTSCFDKLTTPEAKAFLRERWMKWKGLRA
jgi:hypothetical protein